MHKEIAESVKASLREVADSFAGVLNFDVRPELSEQENVHRIIQQTATVCAVLACVNPIPLTDFLILTPLHAKMTFHIGKVKGFQITQERALDILREVLSTVGLSLTATWLASFVKPIPIVNFLVYAPIIYGATYGIGHVIEAYFQGLRTGQIPSADELKAIFDKKLSQGKVEGAGLRKEQLDRAYQDLKKQVEEREARKAAKRENTPLGIRIKEKPVRRPIEKTIGDEAIPAEKPAAPEPEPPLPELKKTIGPATPAAGIEIKATPVEEKKPSGIVPALTAVEKTPEKPAEEKPKLVDELERLAKLKELGALTAEEFELAKKKLLG